ncbi:MAG: DedA family protein [Patescibacteria group bacterium]
MPPLPDNATLQFLILHGYWIAVPIMIVEGPIATVVMAFFASFGFFNPFFVLLAGFSSDMVSDSVFYYIGQFFGQRFIRRFGRYFGLSEKNYHHIKNFYDSHGGKSVFLAKILTGVVPPVFIVAGYSRMNLKKFYAFSALGGIIWSGGLVALGYYFGSQLAGDFRNVGRLFGVSGFALFGLLALFVIYRFYLRKIIERRLHLISNGSRTYEDKI